MAVNSSPTSPPWCSAWKGCSDVAGRFLKPTTHDGNVNIVVGKVLDGELAEAQGLVVVSAAAPSPREASPGTPAAVVEPAALGRPRRRAAVVAVVAVERGSTARRRAPALMSAAAGTAAVVEVPGRGRTRGKRRSIHRDRSGGGP